MQCFVQMIILRLHLLKENKLKVPDDIAVVGFDDIDIAEYIRPALTTVRQPILDLGKTAAQILFDLIEKRRTTPVHRLINVELIKRESA